MRTALLALVLPAATLIALTLGACASRGGVTQIEVPADKFAETFQAARDTLRVRNFALDRVDAPAGVLTTLPKAGEGIARPWEGPTDSPAQDLGQRQQRAVRVTFRTPGSTAPRADDDPSVDYLNAPVATVMVIDASVERVERPGRRAQYDAVRLTSQTVAPELEARGMVPRYSVVIRPDEVLAADLLREIAERAGLTVTK